MTSFGADGLTRFEDLDADEIIPYLFQGSKPLPGTWVADCGFDTLVLCASSFQPEDIKYPEVNILRCPYEDNLYNPPSIDDLKLIMTTAKAVAKLVKERKKVLVTCLAGLNRSGLVTGVAMHLATGQAGERCALQIQKRRKGALFNPFFLRILKKIKEKHPAWTHQTRLSSGK